MRMLCGQSNPLWHYAAGKWPEKVGLLFGPSYFKKQSLREWLPYALDNDAFTLRENWSEAKWLEMLELARMNRFKPQWILVPDKVSSREETLERWKRYSPIASGYGWPLAFAVQDGMTPDDVPANAQIVFVGGSTAWKWNNLPLWLDFPRVHVGRVNAIERVWQCEDAGIESVDGTGWFRDPTREDKLPALREWFENQRRAEQVQLL